MGQSVCLWPGAHVVVPRCPACCCAPAACCCSLCCTWPLLSPPHQRARRGAGGPGGAAHAAAARRGAEHDGRRLFAGRPADTVMLSDGHVRCMLAGQLVAACASKCWTLSSCEHSAAYPASRSRLVQIRRPGRPHPGCISCVGGVWISSVAWQLRLACAPLADLPQDWADFGALAADTLAELDAGRISQEQAAARLGPAVQYRVSGPLFCLV